MLHAHTAKPRRIPLYLELLEQRLPPGNMFLGTSLFSSWEGQSLADDPLSSTSTRTRRDLTALLEQAGSPARGDLPVSTEAAPVHAGPVTGQTSDASADLTCAAAQPAAGLEVLAASLTEALVDPVPFILPPSPPPPGVQGDVMMREWTIPTPNSVPHDVVSDDAGIIWFTEQSANKIGRFDPVKEQFMEFPIQTPGSGPHGIAVAPDNGIWFTEQTGNKIGRIDRTTFAITEYPLPRPGSGPHTPIYDGYGHIWFTEQSGNRIGRLRISDGRLEEWTLRANAGPYGIVADAGGHAWFCEFGGTSNRIGRINAQTGLLREWVLPTANSGPRRLWIDSTGLLWITENRGNKLAMFHPKTQQFREWNTPHANGQPYAITVDQNDVVWYTEFNANYMVRYNPVTNEFRSWMMPTPQERVRFIHVDPMNRVWYENNGNNAIGVVIPQ